MATIHLDIPPHLLAMTADQLIAQLRTGADELLATGRMHIAHELLQRRAEINSILDLLGGRLMNAEGERDAFQRENGIFRIERDRARTERDTVTAERDQITRDRNNFWIQLRNTRRENEELIHTRDNLQIHLTRIRRERDQTNQANVRLRRERDGMQIQSIGALAQYNLVFEQLGRVNAQLVHANNRVQAGINTLTRLRNRLFQQIGALRIQVQWFRIRQLNLPPPPLNNPPDTIWLQLR